jgi:hypothetical protein
LRRILPLGITSRRASCPQCTADKAVGPASRNPTRRRRSDAGMVHLTVRDGRALGWIGEQYGVRIDVAAVVLVRVSEREELSRRTVRVQLDRWERAGLILRPRLYGRSWVVPTAAGLALLGLPLPRPEPPGGRHPRPGTVPAAHRGSHP